LLGEVNLALTMLRISEFWQMAFYGGAIIAAAAAETITRRPHWRRRMWRRNAGGPNA
jgi:ribose/xylose/arabinose/galactoside ABC-type transport system permease subunit